MASERRSEIRSQDSSLVVCETWSKVAIIVLNWNGWRDTIECLESLQRITYPNYEIIVVDNGSSNDSVARIKSWAKGETQVGSKYFMGSGPKPVVIKELQRSKLDRIDLENIWNEVGEISFVQRLVLIENKENLGFAGGCNVGIKCALNAGCDYILLLNNDTVVDRSFLEPAVNLAEEDRGIGIVGGKIYFYNDGKRMWSACGHINWLKGRGVHAGNGRIDRGQFDRAREVRLVSGALMLIRAEILQKVGVLPEEYFFGAEEWDFSVSAYRSGFRLYYVPGFTIYHKVGSSHENLDPKYVYNTYYNKLRFQHKFLPRSMWKFWYLLFSVYCGSFARRVLLRKAHRSNEEVDMSDVLEAIKLARQDWEAGKSISRQSLEEIGERIDDSRRRR